MEDNFGYLFAGFAIGWGIFMGLAYWIYRRVAPRRPGHRRDETGWHASAATINPWLQTPA